MAVATFGNTAVNSLQNIIKSGVSNMDAAVGAAQSGLGAVLNGGAQVAKDSATIRNQANLINTQGNAVIGQANKLNNIGDQMLPYADQVSGVGDTMISNGNTLYEQAQDVFGQGQALATMDPNATGLAGEFMNIYNAMSPDSYVASAASDTQSSYQNAWNQTQRNLSRAGVNVSSGRYQMLQKQHDQALATALAAAKTQARRSGLEDQGKYLSSMTSAANTLYNMGKDSMSQANDMLKSGAGLKSSAADILGNAGSAYDASGKLNSTAASLFNSAAGLVGDAAKLDMSQTQMVENAYKELASVYSDVAAYYSKAGQMEMSANSGGSVGGFTVSGISSNLSNSTLGKKLGNTGIGWDGSTTTAERNNSMKYSAS